ncbi:cupin domain-containing protein [Patescibacteria group bacterium]
MNYKHIKSEEVERQNFGAVRVQNLLSDENYKKISVARVDIIGEQKFGLDKESDVIYYVLDGKGKFFIENDEFDVKKGDLIFIPKNTKYKDSGKLELLAIASPKFDRDKRVRFD